MPLFSSGLAAYFGFDNAHRYRAIYQLRELLKLDKVQFNNMKEKIEKITARRLNIDKTGCAQHQAVEKALEDLQSQLPALFNTDHIEQRLFFATRTILVIHNHRRKQKVKNKKTKARPSLADRMAANLASITKGTQAPRIFAPPAPVLRKVRPSSSAPVKIEPPPSEIPASAFKSLSVPQQHPPTLPPQTPSAKTPSSSISRFGSSKAQASPSLVRHDSSQIDESKAIRVENPSFPASFTSSSGMVVESSTSASYGGTQVGGGQIYSVHKFLEAATPSMTHLLDQFIDFGCLSEGFLYAVSLWPLDRIRAFLKSLPPGPGGSGLTEMEVDILSYHLESYFLSKA